MSLKALAQSLGLSPTTVSRALNGFPEVKTQTRNRVLAEAQRQNYQANPTARRLALGRTDTIGWVYSMDSSLLSDLVYLETITALTRELASISLDFHIITTQDDNEMATYEHLVKGRLVDGLIVSRTKVHDARIRFLQQNNFPFVSYGRCQDTDSPYAWLDLDNQQGSTLLVEHMLSRNWRRIAYLHDDLSINFAHQRYQGFQRAMARESTAQLFIHSCGHTRKGGYSAALEVLQYKPEVIVVDNSFAGAGALRALLNQGYEVGVDIQVAIFNGIPEDSTMAQLPIIEVDLLSPEKIGTQLAQMIAHCVRKPNELLPPQLWQPRLVLPASLQ